MNGAMLFGGGPAVAVAGGDDGPLATKAFDSMNDNVRYERERAALGWTEALTRIAETHAPDADYERLAAAFDEGEVGLLCPPLLELL